MYVCILVYITKRKFCPGVFCPFAKPGSVFSVDLSGVGVVYRFFVRLLGLLDLKIKFLIAVKNT